MVCSSPPCWGRQRLPVCPAHGPPPSSVARLLEDPTGRWWCATRSLRGSGVGGCRGACRAGWPRSDPGARRPARFGWVPPVAARHGGPLRCCKLLPAESSCSGLACCSPVRIPACFEAPALRRLRGEAVGTGVPEPDDPAQSPAAGGGNTFTDTLAGPRPRWLARQRVASARPRPARSGFGIAGERFNSLPPWKFSGGMRQRPVVALAMALETTPG